MTAEPTSRSYYIEQFEDEIQPCEPSLEGWAEWLSHPHKDWGLDAAAPDGDRFKASVVRWGEDVMAVREGGAWRIFNSAAGADLVAARYGKGLGWDSDNLLDATSGDAAIKQWLDEAAIPREGDDQYFALGFNEPDVMLVYHAGVPGSTMFGPSMSIEPIA